MAYNAKSYAATKRYREKNIKRVPLDMQTEDYAEVKAASEATGKKVNSYIKCAIRDAVLRDTGKVIFQKSEKCKKPVGDEPQEESTLAREWRELFEDDTPERPDTALGPGVRVLATIPDDVLTQQYDEKGGE